MSKMPSRTGPTPIPFQKLLDALLDSATPLNPRYLYRLSDLETEDAKRLSSIWPRIELWRRVALLEDIAELSSNDTLLDFTALCRVAIPDEEPQVRALAIQAVDEFEDKRLVPVFILLMEKDSSEAVRAAAATALGQYVYLGEIEELPESTLHRLEDSLLKVIERDEAASVRRYALESLGYSSREEALPLIEKAYASSDKDWIASALFAMGRSGNERWQPQVMAMLGNKLPQLRAEAARAAGELEIAQARKPLLELLEDPDETTRANSIWALSQIGGEGVRAALEALYEATEDDEEMELLSDALDNLEFTEEMALMPIIELAESQDVGVLDEEASAWAYPSLDDEPDDEDDENAENDDESEDDFYGDDEDDEEDEDYEV